jgi:transmembrane sensor
VQVAAERPAAGASADSFTPALLVAGQQAVCTYDPAANSTSVKIHEVSLAETERALDWKFIRLEFADLPLRAVVAEFNRYNTSKLQIADARTGEVLVGGSFRADNVEAFVRLLDAGFDIEAQQEGNAILLKRRN